MRKLIERIVEGCIILGMIWLLTTVGCASVKGLAHDLAWSADKLDKAIVVPE